MNCLEILNKESMIVRNNSNNEILAQNLAWLLLMKKIWWIWENGHVINDFENVSYLNEIKVSYIKKIFGNLLNFLREISNIKDNNEKNNFIYSFTTVFKIGFLLEKILLNQSVLLNNISNLSPQVLERFV